METGDRAIKLRSRNISLPHKEKMKSKESVKFSSISF